MNRKKVKKVTEEMTRLALAIAALEDTLMFKEGGEDAPFYGNKQSAAVRRASLDLSAALVEMRKLESNWKVSPPVVVTKIEPEIPKQEPYTIPPHTEKKMQILNDLQDLQQDLLAEAPPFLESQKKRKPGRPKGSKNAKPVLKQVRLDDLVMSIRLSRILLDDLHFSTLNQVAKMTRMEFAVLRGVGEKLLKEVGELLKENGLKWARR